MKTESFFASVLKGYFWVLIAWPFALLLSHSSVDRLAGVAGLAVLAICWLIKTKRYQTLLRLTLWALIVATALAHMWVAHVCFWIALWQSYGEDRMIRQARAEVDHMFDLKEACARAYKKARDRQRESSPLK